MTFYKTNMGHTHFPVCIQVCPLTLMSEVCLGYNGTLSFNQEEVPKIVAYACAQIQ